MIDFNLINIQASIRKEYTSATGKDWMDWRNEIDRDYVKWLEAQIILLRANNKRNDETNGKIK